MAEKDPIERSASRRNPIQPFWSTVSGHPPHQLVHVAPKRYNEIIYKFEKDKKTNTS